MPNILDPQAQADDLLLQSVTHRQWSVALQVCHLAEALYQARTEWIGGGLPWSELTPGQQHGYRREMEELVRGEA